MSRARGLSIAAGGLGPRGHAFAGLVVLAYTYASPTSANTSVTLETSLGLVKPTYSTIIRQVNPAFRPYYDINAWATDTTLFEVGPAFDIGVAFRTSSAVFAPVITYTPLRGPSEGITSSWGIRFDFRIGSFGWRDRGYIVGGAGLSTRMLAEGLIYEVSVISRDQRVLDMVFRAGAGQELLKFSGLTLSFEGAWYGSYQLV